MFLLSQTERNNFTSRPGFCCTSFPAGVVAEGNAGLCLTPGICPAVSPTREMCPQLNVRLAIPPSSCGFNLCQPWAPSPAPRNAIPTHTPAVTMIKYFAIKDILMLQRAVQEQCPRAGSCGSSQDHGILWAGKAP